MAFVAHYRLVPDGPIGYRREPLGRPSYVHLEVCWAEGAYAALTAEGIEALLQSGAFPGKCDACFKPFEEGRWCRAYNAKRGHHYMRFCEACIANPPRPISLGP